MSDVDIHAHLWCAVFHNYYAAQGFFVRNEGRGMKLFHQGDQRVWLVDGSLTLFAPQAFDAGATVYLPDGLALRADHVAHFRKLERQATRMRAGLCPCDHEGPGHAADCPIVGQRHLQIVKGGDGCGAT